MINLCILGSTGSIGTQTLDIVRAHPDKLSVLALSAGKNWQLLAMQIKEFEPEYAVLADISRLSELKNSVGSAKTQILGGGELLHLSSLPQVNVVVNALVGFAGFESTFHALHSGKKVALANKESLVVGGSLLAEFCVGQTPQLIPVDSEHSAILQCLVGESHKNIDKLIITASGGPFRTKTVDELKKVTVEDALNHPNWSMGAKITIDSASMMNKGLEVIEAKWLFGLEPDQIQAVIHPQSIVHSMVTFCDGSTKAQLGVPDMKLPIQYALSFPDRWDFPTPKLDWGSPLDLTFEPIDKIKFPCFRLAVESMKIGGHAPNVLNAANEIAVQRFLKKEIDYIAIPKIVENTMNTISLHHNVTVSSLIETDAEARKVAKNIN